jgi:predicted DNA-binding protein
MSKRIQVIISEELDKKLTDFSTRYGVSKSSIVGFAVGQWMDRMEKFLDEREVSNLEQ